MSESGMEETEEKEMDRLWTSKDRSKYKKQQRRLLRERERIHLERAQQREREHEILQQHASDDETEATDATEDSTDDGLGYILPNLPIYNSDAESSGELFETEFDSESRSQTSPPLSLQPLKEENSMISPKTSPSTNNSNASLSSNPPYPTQQYNQYQGNTPIQQGQGPPYHYNRELQHQQQQYHHSQQPPHYNHPQQQYQYPQQIPGQHPYNVNNPYPEQQPPYMYPNPQAYAKMNPPPVHQTQQQYQQSWSSSHSHSTPHTLHPGYTDPAYYSHHGTHQHQQRQFQPQPVAILQGTQHVKFSNSKSTPSSMNSPTLNQVTEKDSDYGDMNVKYIGNTEIDSTITLAEAGTLINFDSIQKMFFFLTGVMLLCYCAVSPRTLELVEYNDLFRKNVQNVALIFIGPILVFLSVFDAKDNDINALVSVKGRSKKELVVSRETSQCSFSHLATLY